MNEMTEEDFKKDIILVFEKINQDFGYSFAHEETHSCKHNRTISWILHRMSDNSVSFMYIYYSYNKPVCACHVSASGMMYFYWWNIYNSSTTYRGLYEFLNARNVVNNNGSVKLDRKFIAELQQKEYSYML